ncbi:amino acid ABC transporter permease [Tolumonas lignilytica]|jgi:amine acid ABC transporter, permease protein, 3-TM region, His/Glu/Gln/Arg/opine family|uniref:amino acid ABC transporter permease n=1 Tax=Tolumonas lignilytica TaxID=1283284 RepID=UPI0004673D45|nr:amino acid ABC transporter permease [Tolumonas lignilytica]
MVVYRDQPSLPAPASQTSIAGWLRKNLFSSVTNSVVTLALLYFLVPQIWHAIEWGLLKSDWFGDNRSQCVSGGACWVFITNRLNLFIYGFYPSSAYWRVNWVYVLTAVQVVALLYPKTPHKTILSVIFFVVYPFVVFFLLHGGAFGLPVVETNKWGGLMLTLLLGIVGTIAALPLGIVLALGRRSEMPIIRALSVVFIEFWRAVPLITVLFMASVMLPLFLSGQVNMDKLLRAMIGIILFESAYVAEVIRGGLQAIPKGQYEAAKALGLNYWKSMGLIIMPQALKLTIPSLVNTFIELFKDTSLVTIIGLFDLLSVAKAGLSDPAWLGFSTEAYTFVALVFWVFCFGMSRYSMYLEKLLHTGHKR